MNTGRLEYMKLSGCDAISILLVHPAYYQLSTISESQYQVGRLRTVENG